MKSEGFLLSLITLVVAFLMGCSHRRPAELLQAEAFIDAFPDSSLRMLRAIDPEKFGDESDRLYHTLLLAEAYNKKGDTAAYSLKDILHHYYIEKGNDPDLHQRVYYALGRLFTEKKRYPEAMDYLRKSLRGGDSDADLQFSEKIHAQLSRVFMENKMFRHALIHSMEQQRLSRITRDTASIINAGLWIANEYDCLGIPDSAMIALDELGPIVERYDSPYDRTLYCTQLANILMCQGNFEKADSIIRNTEIVVDDYSRSSVESIINMLNLHFGRVEDLERKSLELLASSDNIFVLKTTAGNLARIYNERGDVAKAIDYSERFYNVVDSISKAEAVRIVGELDKLYSLSESDHANNELRIKNMKLENQRNWIVGGLAAILLIGIFIVIKSRINHKTEIDDEKRRAKERISAVESELKILGDENRSFMSRIATLEKEKKEMREKADLAITDLKRKLSLMEREHDLKGEIRDSAKVLADLSALKNRLRDKQEPKAAIADFISFFGKNYPDFFRAVKEMNLKESEFLDVLLIRAGLSTSDIAGIIELSEGSLYNRRSKLARKLDVKGKGFQNLIDFINSIVEGKDYPVAVMNSEQMTSNNPQSSIINHQSAAQDVADDEPEDVEGDEEGAATTSPEEGHEG